MEKDYGYVALAGILSGGIVFGAQVFANMGLSLYQLSLFPLFVTFILLPLVVFKKECKLRKDMLKFLILYGFIGTLLLFSEFGPIILGVPVAVVVFLLYTQPVWSTIFGRIFLSEEITKYKVLAVALVLVGAWFLIGPLTIGEGGLMGIVLALIGGMLLSIWIVLGRVAGKRKYHPVTTNFGYTFFTIIFVFSFYPLISFFIEDPLIINLSFNLPLEMWLYISVFVFLAVMLPHLLYFRGTRKVSASTAGIILMLEPVSATVLATVFLEQIPTISMVIGGALILAANYLVIRG